MDFLLSAWHYGFWFLLAITALVFVHELGHFLVARYNKVRVEVFSIGFGPELFGWKDGQGTRWKFSALPLGGYVKMFGESDRVTTPAGTERAMTQAEEQVSFARKTVAQRAAIVVAGPLANFLFAIAVLAATFAIYGQPFSSTEIGLVQEGSAAAAAGLKPGDRIVSVNGQEVKRFQEVAAIVQLGLDEPLELVVERDGARVPLTAHPQVIEEKDAFGDVHKIGRLGVESAGVGEVVRHDPLTAIAVAAEETYRMTAGTLKAIGQIFAGSRSADEVGGFLRIAKMSGDVAQQGIIGFIGFTALLSINLGLINLLPVPMLDGGHLAFYAVEATRGRPLGPRAQEWGFRIGLALVFTLMVFATWNDLVLLKVVDYIKGLVT